MNLHQDFKEFIELLNKNNVKYMVIGGYAMALHGLPRYTKDIDIWVKSEKQNAENILVVLNQFGFGSLKITIDDLTKPDTIIQLGYPPIRIDIITELKGLTFDHAYSKKEKIELDQVEINYIDLDSLIINKKSVARDQDILDAKQLEKKKLKRKKK